MAPFFEQVNHGSGGDDGRQQIDPRDGQQQGHDHAGHEKPPSVGLSQFPYFIGIGPARGHQFEVLPAEMVWVVVSPL